MVEIHKKDTSETLERLKAVDHLLQEAVESDLQETDKGWQVTWTSGGEVVLEATVADKDTARLLAATHTMIHIMVMIMDEHDFMGTIPQDIVVQCKEAMAEVFNS